MMRSGRNYNERQKGLRSRGEEHYASWDGEGQLTRSVRRETKRRQGPAIYPWYLRGGGTAPENKRGKNRTEEPSEKTRISGPNRP